MLKSSFIFCSHCCLDKIYLADFDLCLIGNLKHPHNIVGMLYCWGAGWGVGSGGGAGWSLDSVGMLVR